MTFVSRAPAWIAALSKDERNSINNGSFIAERYKTSQLLAKYHAVIEHMEKQPRSATVDQALAVLGVQVELLREEQARIAERAGEWHAYYSGCMAGDENWQTGEPWRKP